MKQLVLPRSLRQEVLQELHDTRTAGHLGRAKTLGRIRQRFYWVQCRKDVQDWCRNCDLCAQKRGPQKKIKAPMRKYIVGSPMERIALDVLGPLPLTESGNKYIVVIADYFTKWVEALPIPDRKPPQLPSYSSRNLFADSECPSKYIPTKGGTLNRSYSQKCANCLASKGQGLPLTTQLRTEWSKHLIGPLRCSCQSLQITIKETGICISHFS